MEQPFGYTAVARFGHRRQADAVNVEYVPEDVRPQGVTPLPSFWLLLDDPSVAAVEVHWEP